VVHEQPPRLRSPLPDGHLERVEDKRAAHVRRELPADDYPAVVSRALKEGSCRRLFT
jgi:hypothetical protein